MNQAIFTGNLTRDPESRSLTDGTAVCTFTIAVNKPNKGGQPQDPDFVKVTAWRNLAENCKRYLTKGRKVLVSGSVSLETYTTKNGIQRSQMAVSNAEKIEFLSPKEDATPAPAPAPAPKAKRDNLTGYIECDPNEDLPF